MNSLPRCYEKPADPPPLEDGEEPEQFDDGFVSGNAK